MTRAQWAVLARLESNEGLKQSELAEMLDLQPITLTRLVDRLCANGLIERRADPNDRRAKRLYLTPAGAAADGPARRARPGHDEDGARRLRSRDDRAHDRWSSRTRRKICKGAIARKPDKPQTRPRRTRRCGGASWPTKVVELRKTQEDVAAPAAEAKPARSRARLRLVLLVVLPLIALDRRLLLLSDVGPLHLDRQRLCRRAEGAHHAGHLRQDRQGHGDRRPARERRRSR